MSPVRSFLPLVLVLAIPAGAFAHPGPHVRIAALSDSLGHASDRVSLWLERADEFLESGNHAAALSDLDRAEALAPGLARIARLRGAILLDLGDAAGAEPYLARAIEQEPADAAGHFLRGRARMALGRAAEASADFERSVLRSTRPTPDHFLEWSRALAASPATGRPADAIAVLDRGIARLGVTAALAEEAVRLECAHGAWDAALERVDRHAAAWGSSAARRARRGDVLREAGREIEAMAEYSAALAELEHRPGVRAAAGSLAARLRSALRQGTHTTGRR